MDYLLTRSFGIFSLAAILVAALALFCIFLIRKNWHSGLVPFILAIAVWSGTWVVAVSARNAATFSAQLAYPFMALVLLAALRKPIIVTAALFANLAMYALLAILNEPQIELLMYAVMSLSGFLMISPEVKAHQIDRDNIIAKTKQITAHSNLLQAVLGGTPQAVIALNYRHDVVLFNQQAETLSVELGGNRIQIGATLQDWAPKQFVQVIQKMLEVFSEGKHAPRIQEIMVDESPRSLELEVAPLELPDGPGSMLVARDVTVTAQLALAEKQNFELATKLRGMEQFNAARQAILNTVSHELNTPITPILLQAKLLRMKIQNDAHGEVGECLEILERNAAKLVELVNEMLDACRVQTGKLALANEQLDVGAQLQSEILSFESRHPDCQLEVEINSSSWINADPRRFGQAVQSLLSNAKNFGNGLPIKVTCKDVKEEAEITVEDMGKGIPSDELEMLFEPMSHARTEDARSGVGLGMAICRGIIEAFGGTVHAESDGAGTGARFVVRIPIATLDDSEE